MFKMVILGLLLAKQFRFIESGKLYHYLFDKSYDSHTTNIKRDFY